MSEQVNIRDVYNRVADVETKLGTVEAKVDDVAGEVHELREDMNDISDRVSEVEQWKDQRDGVIAAEIESYHKSEAYQLVLAGSVVPAMRVAVRQAVSWKRITGAMITLGASFAAFNQLFTLLSNVQEVL